MLVFNHKNYRSFLKAVIQVRRERNSSYSLRALARDLGFAVSTTSEILSGRKNMSLARACQVSERLKLNTKEQEYFCLLVQMEQTKDPQLKNTFIQKINGLTPGNKVSDLQVDCFKLISDWYHFAIFESLEIVPRLKSAAEIAKRLKLKKVDVELALERLERLDLIESTPEGFIKTKAHIQTASSVPNQALKNFHEQMLQKALTSINEQSPQERLLATETLAFDRDQLPEFEKLAEEFIQNTYKLAAKGKNKRDVYHLNLQLFNLTHSKEEK